MAVAFDAASTGTPTQSSPITWSHTNNGNAILVGCNWDTGTADTITAVSYGGVALAKLGSIRSGTASNGGISFWGKIGGLPTGANTVSVTHGASSIGLMCPGAISVSGANSFGAAFTAGLSGAGSVSVNVTGTTSGGLIVATACYGAVGTFSTTAPGTQRWAKTGDNNSGSDNTAGQTCPSPGGTQAIGFSNTVTTDSWGLVAVEVQPWHVLQSNGGNSNASSVAVAYTSALSAGTKLIAAASFGGSGTASVKDGAGNNFTLLASVNLNNVAGNGLMTLWSLDVPAGDVGTTPTITAARTSGNFTALVIQEVSGLAVGTGVTDGAAVTNFGSMSSNGSAAAGAYSSSAAGEYLVAAYGDNETASHTVATPTGSTAYTLDTHSQTANANFAAALAYGNSTNGAETATFAITGVTSASPWATVIAAFTLAGTVQPPVFWAAQMREHAGRRKGRRFGMPRSQQQASFSSAPAAVISQPVILAAPVTVPDSVSW